MNYRDFTTDRSPAFLVLLKEAGAIPEWLQQAPDADEVKGLPTIAFADTGRRLMPIHSKAAAFMSAVSALSYGYPSEGNWENRIKAACHQYGITELVKKAHEVIAPKDYHKEADEKTEKRAYALELEVTAGAAPTPYYPINNQDEVEDSALKMARDHQENRLPESWFVEAAEALMKAARTFDVAVHLIPDSIVRLGEDRIPSPDYLKQQIERRIKQAGISEEAAELYTKAAAGAVSGEFPPMKAAHVWEVADRKFGVRYHDTLVSPAMAFRSGIFRETLDKIAGSVVTIAGVQVPFNALTTLPDRMVVALLPRKSAALVLAAKGQSDGLKAASVIGSLEEREQVELLGLLTDVASVC